jgi:mitogen-activated protein kinase organizer 1
VGRVSFSGDAGCVLAGVVESRLALLDASSGEVLAEYRGHAHERSAIASTLSSDDALVASGSEDGRVVMWELVDADVVASIDAHPKHSACGLDWHPRGDVMATGGTDGLAKLWVPPGGRGRRAQLE